MSTSTAITVSDERTSRWAGRLADYVELTKPRILVMVLVTVGLSALIATLGRPDVVRLLHVLLGTTLVAASASALNQWWERATDALMPRTANRPLPAGRLGTVETLIVSSVAVIAGMCQLWVACGAAAAGWAGLTWLLYVAVYTPLKSRTWLNTVIGAVPGALPVVIGWTGVGAPLDWRAAALFTLVFLWQFPHFMAIAWLYRRQYAAAHLRMVTVVDATGYWAAILAVAAAGCLIIVSLWPLSQVTSISWIYLAATCALGAAQLRYAGQFLATRHDASARRLLRASLVYLPLQLVLFTLLHLAVI